MEVVLQLKGLLLMAIEFGKPFMPYLVGFSVFMQLLSWTMKWYFSVNTNINASHAAKRSNNVIIIGAGFSGIGLGVLLKSAGIEFVILDKAEHVGGTWWYNDYPGAAVDVKSHTYCYSFFPKRMWKDTYSFRDEILQYMVDAVHHFGLKPNLRLKTVVKNGEWNPKDQNWVVTTTTGQTFKGRFLVNCMGFLHKPNIPKVKNMDKFKGRYFHTAQWEHDFDYANKRVAVIGSGCTAIQVIPEVAKVAKEVTMFQRGPSYVVAKNLQFGEGPYGAVMHAMHFLMPWVMWFSRVSSYAMGELFYWGWDESWFGNLNKKSIHDDNAAQIKDDKLRKELLVDEKDISGCKRPALYTNFFRKFEQLGCKVKTQSVTEMTESGILLKDGTTLEVDLVVFATGFDMMHYKDVPMIANGKTFDDFWSDVPYAFQGVLHPNFPNYFMLLGPQSGQIHGAGSVYYGEMQAELIMNILKKVLEEGKSTFQVKQETFDKWVSDYEKHIRENKAWLTGCNSWYNKHGGKPWQPYIYHSWRLMSECKWPKLDQWLKFN